MELRVMRVAIPRFRRAREAAGRMRCAIASTRAPASRRKIESRMDMWVSCQPGSGVLLKSPLFGRPRTGPIPIARTTAPRYAGVAQPPR